MKKNSGQSCPQVSHGSCSHAIRFCCSRCGKSIAPSLSICLVVPRRRAGAMKALVKSRNQVCLWLEEVPEPQIGINDVKVRLLLTGICGTDLHIYDWDEWARATIPVPLVIGHEFVGEIVEVGSNVNDFYPGDLVSGEGHVVCGRCRNCLAGRRHLCARTQGVGVNRPGAFAEYIVLPMSNIWRHDPKI